MDDGGLRASLQSMWASVAPSWGYHADYVDTRGAAVAEAMVDAARLQPGQRVLELASGPGGVGITAAAVVGPSGEVVLSDIAAEMTAIAAERAKNAGLYQRHNTRSGPRANRLPGGVFRCGAVP